MIKGREWTIMMTGRPNHKIKSPVVLESGQQEKGGKREEGREESRNSQNRHGQFDPGGRQEG